MSKMFYSLGLMSGTSGDGVDASIIKSDGQYAHESILDKYYEYDQWIYKEFHKLKDKVNNSKDLKKFSADISSLEIYIDEFNIRVVEDIIKTSKVNIDLIGLHGQTIFHNAKEKISKQLGSGSYISISTSKPVFYNFRENDMKNGGQGAPLTPVFHHALRHKFNIKLPVIFLNIGGIANITVIDGYNLESCDIGPGNCLIDQWIRNNSKKKYDEDGKIAKSGKINKTILNKALENFKEIDGPNSYDVKDFDLNFANGLSLEDGVTTITEYTSQIISKKLHSHPKNVDQKKKSIFVCGGGRKNSFLIQRIEEKIKSKINLIDDLGINGDFVESQAFAYLAIRSNFKKPISFPETTGCKKKCTGGELAFKNIF